MTVKQKVKSDLEASQFKDHIYVSGNASVFRQVLSEFHRENPDKIFVTKNTDKGLICVRVQ